MKYFLFIFLTAATLLSVFATYRGCGLPAPVKQPVSIREGSVAQGGHYRPRYFIGGGFVGGK